MCHMLVTGDKITCDFTSQMEQEISFKKDIRRRETERRVQFLWKGRGTGGGGGRWLLPLSGQEVSTDGDWTLSLQRFHVSHRHTF